MCERNNSLNFTALILGLALLVIATAVKDAAAEANTVYPGPSLVGR